MKKENKIMGETNLISYAMDFASYVLLKVDSDKINKIILHGSVAKEDSNEKSDVDIFLDVKDGGKKIQDKIEKITESYYKTKKFKEWELKGIENPLSVIVGNLESSEWKNLKRAIINTGILLYGKFKENVEKTNQYVLLSFENIKPEKKRVSVYRKLFGFKKNNKNQAGDVEKFGGRRIGKGVVLMPVENIRNIEKYLKEKKVKFKVYDFWSDEKV